MRAHPLLLAVLLAGATPLHAGELAFSAGPVLLQALDPRTTAVTEVVPSPGTLLLGIPERFEPQVGVRTRDAWTLGLGARYTANRRVYFALDLGVPPELEVLGSGVAAAPGPAGATFALDLADPAIQPLATPRQWSPAASVEYRARPAGAALRPFVSAGVTYTWFTGAAPGAAFERALDERFGQPLANGAGKPGPTRAQLEIDSLWAPVLGAGLHWSPRRRFTLTAGAAWIPLRVDATLTQRASDGSLLATTRTTSRTDGLVVALVAGWRWERS